jgi:multicomponent K+:H+ antiporter subunit C
MSAWIVATGIGVLTACGVWLVLRPRTFDVALGLTLMSYATNLFIVAMGRLVFGKPPVLRPGVAPTLVNYADPLPQALVLTAIVIAFAMTALTLVLAMKSAAINDDDASDPAEAPDAVAQASLPRAAHDEVRA